MIPMSHPMRGVEIRWFRWATLWEGLKLDDSDFVCAIVRISDFDGMMTMMMMILMMFFFGSLSSQMNRLLRLFYKRQFGLLSSQWTGLQRLIYEEKKNSGFSKMRLFETSRLSQVEQNLLGIMVGSRPFFLEKIVGPHCRTGIYI